MNRFLSCAILLVACLTLRATDDETFRKGLPGSYSRLLGMEAVIIDLRFDGIYAITSQGCLWSETGKGRWTVKEGIVILDGLGHPEDKKNKLTKFEIVPVDHDLALRAIDDIYEAPDSNADAYLFRHQKKEG